MVRRHFSVAFCILQILAGVKILTFADSPAYAQAPVKPSNSVLVFLKRSDVLLSPRFYRPEWRKAFESFGATKIVWTYGADRFFCRFCIGQYAAAMHIAILGASQ